MADWQISCTCPIYINPLSMVPVLSKFAASYLDFFGLNTERRILNQSQQNIGLKKAYFLVQALIQAVKVKFIGFFVQYSYCNKYLLPQ